MFGINLYKENKKLYPYVMQQIDAGHYSDLAKELAATVSCTMQISSKLPWKFVFVKTPEQTVAVGGKLTNTQFWELWAVETKDDPAIGMCFRCRGVKDGEPVTPDDMNIVDLWNHQAYQGKISDRERLKLVERMRENNKKTEESTREKMMESAKEEAAIGMTADVNDPGYRRFAADAGVNPTTSVAADLTHGLKKGRNKSTSE